MEGFEPLLDERFAIVARVADGVILAEGDERRLVRQLLVVEHVEAPVFGSPRPGIASSNSSASTPSSTRAHSTALRPFATSTMDIPSVIWSLTITIFASGKMGHDAVLAASDARSR